MKGKFFWPLNSMKELSSDNPIVQSLIESRLPLWINDSLLVQASLGTQSSPTNLYQEPLLKLSRRGSGTHMAMQQNHSLIIQTAGVQTITVAPGTEKKGKKVEFANSHRPP